MNGEDHRFDTAELDPARHGRTERKRRQRRKFGEHRVPRWVYRIVLILLLCVLSMLVWFNRSNLTPANVLTWVEDRVVGMGVGDGYPYEIAGSAVLKQNFASEDKGLYLVSDTAVMAFNASAKPLVNRQHSFSSPVLKACGSRMLVYNLGGRGCQVESLSKTIAKFNADGDILAGAISPSGRYALVTQADGYCGKLTAYSSDGHVQSYYWFSDYYPTAVALSPDGTRAAVTGVSSKNGEMVSALYLIDLNSGKAVAPFAEYEDNLLFSVSWDSESAVSAVGDKAVTIANPNSRAKADYNFNGRQLTAYCTNGGKTALGLSNYEGSSESELILLDQNGSSTFNAKFEKQVAAVSIYGQTLAALSGGKVTFYPASGPAKTADAGNDARTLALCDESSAYVLGVSEIRLIYGR